MKKISLVLVLTMFVTVLSGCSLTVNGKKVISINEDKKITWPAGNETAEKTDVMEMAVDSQDSISVSNASGKIIFKTWDNDKVQVTAAKKIRAGGDKEKLNELLNDIKINMEKSSGNIEVKVKYIDGMWGFNHQNVELEVMVPKKLTDIKANSASGAIEITDFKALKKMDLTSVSGSVAAKNTDAEEFEVGTTSGSVNIDGVTGNGYIHAVSGSIDAINVKGDCKYKTTSGSINSNGAEGAANVSTVSGSINISSNYLKSSEFHSTSGSLNVEAAKIDENGNYNVNSVSGEVYLRLPQDAGFELDASSTSGNIRNEFSITIDGGNGKKDVQGTVGNGGANIKIHTVSGGISILK